MHALVKITHPNAFGGNLLCRDVYIRGKIAHEDVNIGKEKTFLGKEKKFIYSLVLKKP